ncbi:hypothetical protein NONS58_31890 [Nitrosococcus oceani]|nr:hypothetical protein NONS58_31890 [Nitrosococcus oceani]
MEAQATLIGTEGTVEADSKAPVNLHLAAIILPGHAEDDLSLRFANARNDFLIGIFWMMA